VCDSFYFILMFVTPLLSFHASLKEKEMIEDVQAEAPTDDCPEGTINLMVVKIASENLAVSTDLEAIRTTPEGSGDDIDRVGETEV
jgi:hypothetical protein